ncbi:MAG: ATP-binding protein [Lachnospiraceae bacterium]
MKKFSEVKKELMQLSLPIGLVIVTAYPEYHIIFANEKFCEMIGITENNKPLQTIYKSAWNFVYKADVDWLKELAALRSGQSEPYEVAYRMVKKGGSLLWVNQCSQHMIDDNGNELVYAYYTDITIQKQTEQALRESEFRYAAAVHSANINIWEYDYHADTMTIYSKSPKINSKDTIISNYTKDVISEGHITEESAVLLFEMIAKLKKGEKEVSADLWIRQNKEEEFWCERVIYTNSFDDTGKPMKAYCVGRDITKEKEAEKRYHEELSYREAMQKATMASINVNLTKNIIMDYKSIFPKITAHMSEAKTVQEYFEQVYTELETQKMQQECAAMFNRDALLWHFANGETTVSMELTRMIAGRRYWTVMTAHMMKKEENSDVVAFLYSTNITNEKTMQNVMNAIVKTDYDFLVVVDAIRNSAVRYSEKELSNRYAWESNNFEEETCEYMRHYICKEDVEHVIKEVTLQNIIAKLDQYKTYSVFYKIPNQEGEILHKQLRFSYINSELKNILMTRIDITAAVTEQEKKNQELVAAVEMAERANDAKSEFLSRISHEIRTPMNAIIGMAQIALQNIENKELAKESIEKSLYASQYLLILLNDILDMSKIESGKVTLKNGVIVCKKLLDAINTIIDTQAKAKGVIYKVNEFAGHENSYLGDDVRIQQILINILSNAVKFTPKGGTVCLDIFQIGKNEDSVNICFKISDTGIGISEEFLPNIFKPFSQEHNSAASDYGGSGLGLAISENLARLMGGEILVESKLGKGTIFYVKVVLGILKNSSEENVSMQSPKKCEKYDFSGKKILLIEDHQLNIMIAQKLLEFKKAVVDVAVNGKIGLTMFKNALEHTYDAVLMDIRMPVMDGLQSAHEIRNLDSEWAKKVPIIAMSANAFEEDVVKSKKAGMNAHLAKPIDSQLLYHTLCKFMQKDGGETDG